MAEDFGTGSMCTSTAEGATRRDRCVLYPPLPTKGSDKLLALLKFLFFLGSFPEFWLFLRIFG